ncbi:hypothetical protein F4678DRAFT_143302 [Xylaria arbuscula]|nr:hypothetical protein F4678DRAFT_143302 [Xylaria arbuscula]
MASLNLSSNGPSIKSSYQGVISAPAPPAGSSSTYGQWVLLSVQAPLANAFQDSGSKESVLKVQSTGDGELEDLLEDFSEGRIQFAFVKVKDPNTGLPKYALIAWCGGGVPERTKGYFTSHLNAVSKVLHGYHVQITARTDADLEPTNILKKVADASGANYTAGGSAPVKPKGPPPAVKSKPVFAASSSASVSFNPIIAARNASLRQKKGDDGWGDDAPPVSRTEIQKVQSAYKPTKVNIDELRNQKQAPSKFNGGATTDFDDRPRDVIGGSYKPVGKVDINAIRAAARDKKDERPTPVKGAYEPVGKVDIAAIRAKAQKPSEPEPENDNQSKSLAERSAAFSRSERLTELPKPKVAKKFSGASSFIGTKAPTPGALGFGGPSPAAAAPVGSASRTFADQGGKTPAQIWAEKKAQQGGGVSPKIATPSTESSALAQKNDSGWQSGYSGKSWKAVETGAYGRGIPGQKTGETASSQEATEAPSAGISAIRDQFNETPPPVPSVARPREIIADDEPAPPPPPTSSRPSDGGVPGGFALPGMPRRPEPAVDEEPEPEPERERSPSPVRIPVPVPRAPEPEIEPVQEPAQSLPVRPIEREVLKEREIPPEEETHDPRAASLAVAAEQFSPEAVAQAPAAVSGGKRALIQYDYEKAEDNELELREGEYVTNIDMVDEDWWMGTNSQGETGLFPSNYVELVDDEPAEEAHAVAPPSPQPAAATTQAPAPTAVPEPAPAVEDLGHTATAQFDYEAAEDNELSFPENAKVTHLEFPDEDWWYGHYNGEAGLFPANYVQLDQ